MESGDQTRRLRRCPREGVGPGDQAGGLRGPGSGSIPKRRCAPTFALTGSAILISCLSSTGGAVRQPITGG
jgi:hypothetical protein